MNRDQEKLDEIELLLLGIRQSLDNIASILDKRKAANGEDLENDLGCGDDGSNGIDPNCN